MRLAAHGSAPTASGARVGRARPWARRETGCGARAGCRGRCRPRACGVSPTALPGRASTRCCASSSCASDGTIRCGRSRVACGARPGNAVGEAPQARGEAQVFAHRQVAVECGVLKYEPDAAPHGEALAHDVVSRNARSAAGGREESREQVNRGGLTGAVRPEQAEELAIPDLEVEPIESADRAKVLAEAAGVDRGSGHPFAARTRDAGAAR